MQVARRWKLGALLALLLSTALAGCSTAKPSPAPSIPPAAASAVKLLVSADGMYRVAEAELRQAGLAVSDPQTLRLVLAGVPQPSWVQQAGESWALVFYGTASTNPYLREQVYWLELGSQPGLAMAEQPAPPVGAPIDHYTATVRLEEQRLYAPQAPGEHWFWLNLPAPKTAALSVTVDALAADSAHLTLGVWGSTASDQTPDHHLKATLNSASALDASWDGNALQVLTATHTVAGLRDGINQLSIEAPGDTGVLADTSYLDWLELRYLRRFQAQNDRLLFTSPGGQAKLAGFSGSVALFDITNPQQAARLPEAVQAGETALAATQAGQRYAAVGPNGWQSPQLVAVSPSADLRAPGRGADYLAIGPPELLAPLAPLIAHRASQGLKTEAVAIGDIFDQFGSGAADPAALREFLRYASQAWQPAPSYVLLVGDASSDPRGYLGAPPALAVPTFMIDTAFGGQTGSDVLFAQLDDDRRPDLALGRLPARTPDHVAAAVRKIIDYEQNAASGPWQRSILAVADGTEPAFRQAADGFLANFAPPYAPVPLSFAPGDSQAPAAVTSQIGQGHLLVAYFGHGSVTQWGKDRLLSNADSAGLTTAGHLPIIINMTCLTGLFIHPRQEALAEALLWQPDGGAVALLAPTSLTLPTDQHALSAGLADAFARQRLPTLGKALLHAQRQMPAESGADDVLLTFLLFGDPALTIAYPQP